MEQQTSSEQQAEVYPGGVVVDEEQEAAWAAECEMKDESPYSSYSNLLYAKGEHTTRW